MTIGDFIKDYRRLHGMSMDEFAKLSGLSKSYISMLEKNMSPHRKKIVPSLETIAKIADAVQIELDELVKMLDQDVRVNIVHAVPNPACDVEGVDYFILDKDKELSTLIENEQKKRDFILYCYEHATLEERNRILSILKAAKRWKEYKEMSDIFHKEP
jgi:transcriptional regulator with XRE-family HTH domain